MRTEPFALTAVEAATAIVAGRLSSVDLVKSCLTRIKETDSAIEAWAYLDEEAALAQASECDRIRKAGYATGPLHGVPVGLKDIVDTRDMPTERGTPVFTGRQPEKDARIVELLRDAGAVIMGKTVTTELAFMHPSKTRNPHNRDFSPGGSSSGSAAAVAACHVPLAIGTQTNGSMIRPASYCGVYGFKPTRGMISRSGVLQTSVSLDQIGTFGRTLADAALLADVIGGYDQNDPASFPRPRPSAADGVSQEVPVAPDFSWLDLPYFDRLADDAREGLEEVISLLEAQVKRETAANTLSDLVRVQACIHEYEICQHQAEVFKNSWELISDTLKPIIERGQKISAEEYEDSLEVKRSAESFFDEFFTEFDAIIAPAAPGEAPPFGKNTGDPIFSTIWTLAGLPCVTLPLLVGANDLPIGVQLIGPKERDDRLMRTANWLQQHLTAEAA